MDHFDYVKPVVLEFSAVDAKGGSCYVDCTQDQICATPADKL